MECNLYDSVNSCSNIDDAWDMWSFKVNKVMNKHAPHRVKSRFSPWITRDIKSLMYRRAHIHNTAKKIKDIKE